MGDFYNNGIAWENWTTLGFNETSKEFIFIETLWDNCLYHHILKPTRMRQVEAFNT